MIAEPALRALEHEQGDPPVAQVFQSGSDAHAALGVVGRVVAASDVVMKLNPLGGAFMAIVLALARRDHRLIDPGDIRLMPTVVLTA